MKDSHFISPLDVLIYLRTVMPAAGVSRGDLAAMGEAAKERHLRAGQTLLTADDPVTNIYILVDGQMEVDTGAYTEVLEPPCGLNWLRLLGGYETSHAATAVTDCLVLELDAALIIDRLETTPSMLQGNLKMFARNVLRLRSDLPIHPDEAEPAEPGVAPDRPLGLVDRLNRVAGPGQYWGDANLDAVVTIVREMEEVRFQPGEELFGLGERSPYNWAIVSGIVECANDAGESVQVGAGFGLGFMHAMGDVPTSFRAVAVQETVALRAKVDEMLAVMEHHTDMAFALLRGMSRAFAEEYDKSRIREIAPEAAAAQ